MVMEELKAFNIENDTKDSSDSTNDLETDVKRSDRGLWAGRFEFLLAIIGYTVGVGSIWRFPIICAKNGGGAFLIPFAFFLITCGGPLYYLEVCLGQFSGKSAVLAFELCPLFKGLGFLMVMISFLVTWYIMVVLMWTLYFLYNSFFPVLPWTTCDNWWNTKECRVAMNKVQINNSLGINYNVTDNGTLSTPSLVEWTTATNHSANADTSAAFEFWNVRSNFISPNCQVQVSEHESRSKDSSSELTNHYPEMTECSQCSQFNVLGKSSGLEEFGSVQLHLIVCLFLAWTIIVLAIIRGVKTLGKVVYITATAPYFFLTVMLVRGLTLDGSLDGITYYVTPDFEKISHYEVWLEAAVQVFYSLGPTWGGVITMASYNKFHKKSFWDTAFCCSTDIFTAFYSGLVVFSIIGFMAKESGSTVEELSKVSGPGLVFIAYPTALGKMPLPQFWAVLFFLMLVTVALDTDFGMFETVTSALIDVFPDQLTKRRTLVNILTGLMMFLIGIPFTCNGGIYLFQLVDWYSSAFALLLGSALEGIIVCWIYGADRFSKDIAIMTGRETSVFLRVLWVIVVPSFMAISFLLLLAGYSQPDYGDGYKYEPYAIGIGILLGLFPVFALIGGGIWQVMTVKGNILKRLKILLKPSEEWGPASSVEREIYHFQPYIYENTFLKRLKMDIRGTNETPWF